jgi:hypothetical protein
LLWACALALPLGFCPCLAEILLGSLFRQQAHQFLKCRAHDSGLSVLLVRNDVPTRIA